MTKFYKYIYLILFSLTLWGQNNDKLVKGFIRALIQRDKPTLQNYITYLNEEEFRFLWDIPKHSITEEKDLLTLLNNLKVEWLEKGDTINLSKGGTITLNNNMVNKNHKVALLELRGYGTPIQLTKQGQNWKIYPQLIITNNRLRLQQHEDAQYKQFKLTINNYAINIDENEQQQVSIDGKVYNITLQSNNNIPYNGLSFDTIYHKDFHKFSHFENGQETLSLIGVESLRALINSFSKQHDDASIYTKMNDLIKNIYFEDDIKEKEENPILRNINGIPTKGKRYITVTDAGVYYDEIFIIKGTNYKFSLFLHTAFKDLSLFEKYFEITLKKIREKKHDD